MKNIKSQLFKKEQSFLPYANFADQVNRLCYQDSSDEILKKDVRALNGSSLLNESDLVTACALLKEIIYRLTGLSLFDTQLSTAYSLYNGNIAELPTGEGKTMAAVLPAILWAMCGLSVHVLVFNDYLAKRDYSLTQPIYEFCGLSVGLIQQAMMSTERKKMYASNIVYLCAKEAGFDYLKNFLVMEKDKLLCADLDCAIVDEADSILIDEAKIPLVVAGSAPEEFFTTTDVSRAVKGLPSEEVKINRSANQAYLTDAGISRMETALNIKNLYAPENLGLLSKVNASLQAQFLLIRDKDYLVKDGSIQIIDEFTGRISENRRYPDLLHSAVEAKEDLESGASSMIYNSMTMQSFLLKYRKLCGMTGTACSSANEIRNMYGLEVDVIPPHKTCIRVDHEDVLFYKNEDRNAAAVAEIKRAHEKGQPVLIGTQSVRESEKLSALLLKAGIPHSVLNAKNDESEAELVSKAGALYRVTVSTNMAGRGVDIRLGGADEAQKAEVQATGGLYVIGVGMNRSIRIDNQLRGRAGRQGDAGESRFFISLEDRLMAQFDLDRNIRHSDDCTSFITDRRLLQTVRTVQKYVQGEDAEARYMLEKYAYIQEEQRRVISELRSGILLDRKPFGVFAEREPQYCRKLMESVGEPGVKKAEKQLALYFINLHWAQYLESMEYVRDGIHLTLIGGKNPIDEYHRAAISAFEEMTQDIITDVVSSMKKYPITADGIDMKKAGLCGATTTWTYLIDESSNQFNRLPYLVKNISNQLKGTVFTVSNWMNRMKKGLRRS